MADICLLTYLQQNISYICTRVPILNTVMFLWDRGNQILLSESHLLVILRLLFLCFLASDGFRL